MTITFTTNNLTDAFIQSHLQFFLKKSRSSRLHLFDKNTFKQQYYLYFIIIFK